MKTTLAALLSLIVVVCGHDYQIADGKTVIETVVETVEVEVEVPGEPETIYIEVGDTGEVETGEVWVDSFTQPSGISGVDILWVIDTSGSMHRYDAELLAGIDAMMAALPPTGWRLNMISNDPARATMDSQFPLVPGDTAIDAQDMYTRMSRGPFEAGFDATYEYIINNPYAATWMRTDAALLIVFVSDEEEQSRDTMINVDDFISWYSSQRATVFLASVINIEEADTACTPPASMIDIGHRYMEATNFYGGSVVDICSDDWTPGVAAAAHEVSPHEKWRLTYIPVESSIVVFINGVLNTDWNYDSTSNEVVFSVIPDGGRLVEIGYIIESETTLGTGEVDTGLLDTGP